MKSLEWRGRALATVLAASMAFGAYGSSISWVSWTDGGGTGPYLINGSGSGLTVTGSFGAKATGTGSNWYQNTANITDVDWPYADTTVTFWQVYKSTAYSTTATFDFSNVGGLAAGGSLSLLDLERSTNSIAVSGYQWDGSAYQLVAVNWAFNNFTINPASSQAVWNSGTNTLTGGGGTVIGGIDTFSMLTSDVRLDRIVLTLSIPTGDGIGIGFTQANIAAALVPLPGAAGFAALGLVAMPRRRRR